jgi:hypothetical protein
LERNCLEKKKISAVKEEPIKFADQNGYLNFWHLDAEVQHLIALYGRAYVRLKLLRGHSGRSPKVQRMLSGWGLLSKKINSESQLMPVDRHGWLALKTLRSVTMISEVQAHGEKEVLIKPVNPVSIQKRYFKKDSKKNLKGVDSRDYLCIVRSRE